jgi:hypothetical protein
MFTDVFERLYRAVYGAHKKLGKKPNPWKLSLILEIARSSWAKVHGTVMEKFGATCKWIEYRYLFDLLDNLVPVSLDVYASIFRSGNWDQYLDAIVRLWAHLFFTDLIEKITSARR